MLKMKTAKRVKQLITQLSLKSSLRYVFKAQDNTIHPHQLGDGLKLKNRTDCQTNVVDDCHDENQENL